MCGPSAVDTSRQEEEARRQREEDRKRAEEERAREQAEYDRRYAQEQERARRAEEQRRQDAEAYQRRLEEVERQRLENERRTTEENRRAREEENARREQERRTAAEAEERRAQEARNEATARQARIDGAVSSVDNAFAGFNDDYFNKFVADYTGFYAPQIGSQYDDAVKKKTYDLAEKGTLDSTTAAKAYGKLAETRAAAEAKTAADARNAANNFRAGVIENKNNLRSMAQSGAQIGDPSLVASGIQRPTYSALGDVFAGMVSSAAKRAPQPGAQTPGLYNNTAPAARVVN